MIVAPFAQENSEEWDDLVRRSRNGTFLHTRSFLSYHRNRFQDRSLLIRNHKQRLIGVFPAAVDPADESVIISHPGITYGGLVHAGALLGAKMVTAIDLIGNRYRLERYRKLLYKPVPYIFHTGPADDERYALHRCGARCVRCDLSTAIDLENRWQLAARRRRSIRKARKNDVKIVAGFAPIEDFWHILSERLRKSHNTKPVHTVDDLRILHDRFPKNIELITAWHKGACVAGAVLFISDTVIHAQYIAANDAGKRLNASDAIVEWCITSTHGRRYFDFGISTEDQGRTLNDGLNRYKNEFGGGGVVYELFEIQLLVGDGNTPFVRSNLMA